MKIKYLKWLNEVYVAIILLLFFTSPLRAQSHAPYHGGIGDGYASAEIQNVVLDINPSFHPAQTVNLYPNPAKTSENLQIMTSQQGTFQVEITNILGQVVFSQNYSGEKTTIPLAGYNPGSYIVRIRNGNSNYIQKLVIANP